MLPQPSLAPLSEPGRATCRGRIDRVVDSIDSERRIALACGCKKLAQIDSLIEFHASHSLSNPVDRSRNLLRRKLNGDLISNGTGNTSAETFRTRISCSPSGPSSFANPKGWALPAPSCDAPTALEPRRAKSRRIKYPVCYARNETSRPRMSDPALLGADVR